MRSGLTILLCCLGTGGALLAAHPAQAQALPLDEQGKVSFYSVVPADSLWAGTLYGHAKAWLRRRGYVLTTADSVAGRLVATHALSMYDRGYLTKKLHGKVPCHGIGGMVGMIMTGIFASKAVNSASVDGLAYGGTHLFVIHLLALVLVSAFAFGGSFVLLKLTDLIIPLRVSAEEEAQGLDVSQHEEQVYSQVASVQAT